MPRLHEAADVSLSLQDTIVETANLLKVSTQDVERALAGQRLPEGIQWHRPELHSPYRATLTGVGTKGGSYNIDIRALQTRTLDKGAFKAAGSPSERIGEFMKDEGKNIQAIRIDTHDQAQSAKRDKDRELAVNKRLRFGRGDDNTPFEQ